MCGRKNRRSDADRLCVGKCSAAVGLCGSDGAAEPTDKRSEELGKRLHRGGALLSFVGYIVRQEKQAL